MRCHRFSLLRFFLRNVVSEFQCLIFPADDSGTLTERGDSASCPAVGSALVPSATVFEVASLSRARTRAERASPLTPARSVLAQAATLCRKLSLVFLWIHGCGERTLFLSRCRFSC